MSAEQHNVRFSIGKHYQQELTQPPNNRSEEETKADALINQQLNLAQSFRDLLDFSKRLPYAEALERVSFALMMNMWTLRQEMTGDRHTMQIVTPVAIAGGQSRFRSALFANGKNLEEMYRTSLSEIPVERRARAEREINQVIARYRSIAQLAEPIDFTAPPEHIDAQLEAHGYHKERIPLTPGLISNIDSLRATIHSTDELHSRLGTMIDVWIAPKASQTVSPQHWSHAQGKTSFVWSSTLVVLADTYEIAILDHGIFSKTKLPSVLRFLSYGQEEERVFENEEELMIFCNMITTETGVPPTVVLDFIIDELGRKFVPAGSFDRHVVPGPLDIRPFIHEIQELFQFEFERIQENPAYLDQIPERLTLFASYIKQQLAFNKPDVLPQLVEQYKGQFSTLELTRRPIKEHEQLFQTVATKLDRIFRVKLNWSLIDCVANTPGSLVGKFSGAQLDKLFGVGASATLEHYRVSGVHTIDERNAFCKRFGKDPNRYSTQGECAMCHKKGVYIWPSSEGGCNVCPVCEVLDSMGRSPQEAIHDSPAGTSADETLFNSDGTPYRVEGSGHMDISTFFTSCVSPSVLGMLSSNHGT